MKAKKSVVPPKHCPSCGAPIVSEICAYCGTATGLNTAQSYMEYPLLECKAAEISFWTLGFPMIFALAFGLTGLSALLMAILVFGTVTMLLIGLPFMLIGLAALCLTLRTLSRYIKVKTRGNTIRATVYGYMDDSLLINNQAAQIVKLLVQTSDGPRFILYKLGSTLKPYGINDTIDITVYQTYFLIPKQ